MRLYWKCQLWGWSGMVAWNMVISAMFGTVSWKGLGLSLMVGVVGLALSHVARAVALNGGWKELTPGRLAPRVLLASTVAAMVAAAITLPVLLSTKEQVPGGPEVTTLQMYLLNVVSYGFIFFGWYLVYFCYHYFQRSREAAASEWRLRVAMRENELRTLRAQLNPHFLFNSLNSLRGLIPESPSRAQEAVTSLAGLLRHTLRLSSRPMVTLEEELAAAEHYLALESIRFEERLAFTLDVDPALHEQAVPPMLLQNLLENALKHGIARRRAGGRVEIVAAAEGDRVRIRITNPGTLPTPVPHSGVGLANATEQLHLLFGEEATLQLFEESPGKVVCEVILPRTRAHPHDVGVDPGVARPADAAVETAAVGS